MRAPDARVLLLAATLGIFHSQPARAGTEAAVDENLDRIAAAAEGYSGFTARFEQEKHVSLLDEPLRTAGIVHYESPDRFVWKVREPEVRRIVVSEQGVIVDGRVADAPIGIGRGVRILGAALEGDRDALGGAFRMSVESSEGAVELTLAPRWFGDAGDRRIRVRFSEPDLLPSALEIVEPEGDRLEIRFHDVERIPEDGGS